MSEVRDGDQKVQKYLISEMFYGRQEVHRYLISIISRNIFILIIVSRIHYSSFVSYGMFGKFFRLRDRVLGVKLGGRSPRLLKPWLQGCWLVGWLAFLFVLM